MRPDRLALLILTLTAPGLRAEGLDYAVADPELKVVRLDAAPTESFLGVRADPEGRLFVGGRESLFVYEPDGKGGYLPRKLLYKFPSHTWVGDIAIRGDDLYVVTVSALYRIPGGRVQRDNLTIQRLLWGVPLGHVHQCLHALDWGPEGDLYVAMGDPVWYYGDFNRPDHWGHWTFHHRPEGSKTPYTGVGGVFRIRPDGSGFRVVARGLRNACGLAFDSRWNLFTNDNDHESIPAEYVPGRLLHVTPGAYFSWPRGWMAEKSPDRMDLLQTLTPGLGRFVPVGQAYYHDTYLPEKYRNNLLVARWGTRALTRYPLVPRGASFVTEEQPLLVGRNQARPVGVCVGRGGRIFATVCYMAHNEGSPIYQSDLVMITRKDDPDTHPFEGYDVTTARPEKLVQEILSPSWSRRAAAHQELLRRRAVALDAALSPLAEANERNPARLSYLWLSAAIHHGARAGHAIPLERLARAAKEVRPEVRAHALRALAEYYPESKEAREACAAALTEQPPPVPLAALGALFRVQGPLPAAVVAGPAQSRDTYLRQTAAFLLAEKESPRRLTDLCRDDVAAVRLAGVLAVGFRLTVPPATAPVPEGLPLEKLRAEEEACVIQYADARVDLRQHGRLGNFTVAEHWKASRHTPDQEALFGQLVARLDDADERVRLQAAYFLSLLNDPRSEPQVARVRKTTEERRLSAAPVSGLGRVWVAGPFPDGDGGFRTMHAPERGPVNLATAYDNKQTWKEMAPKHHYDFRQQFGACDRSSFYAFCRLESANRQRIFLLVGSDDGVKVWHNGREVWANDATRGALPFHDVVSLELQPGSNDLLIRVRNHTGECGLYLHYRALGKVVARLPEKVATATLAERLKSAGPGDAVAGAFLKVDWEQAARRGDAARGRQLFEGLGCAKCHAVSADVPVEGGPSLTDAARRFTVPHLVESILLPGKQVSPVFQATLVALKNGQSLTGLVLTDTGEKVELLLPDATRKTVVKGDIEERKLLTTSPMPQGVVKTPEELRDLLAYLLADRGGMR